MIRNFRITFYRIIRRLFDEIFRWESKNIARWQQRQALEETGRFVNKNLFDVKAFRDRYDMLSTILGKIEFEQEGLVCEFGVAGGRSINHIAKYFPSQAVYGFDSFEGLPEDWGTVMHKGEYKQANLPKVHSNVILVEGLFDESLEPFLAKHPGKALFLHIDCDLYKSTKTVFDLIGPRIESGTVIAFDEFFNYPNWKQGEFKVFMEFIARTDLKYEYLGYNKFGTEVALRIL